MMPSYTILFLSALTLALASCTIPAGGGEGGTGGGVAGGGGAGLVTIVDAGPIGTPICDIGRDPAQPCHTIDGLPLMGGACCVLKNGEAGRCIPSGGDSFCEPL